MRRNLLLALLLSLSLPAVAAAQDNAGTYDLHDLTAFGVIDPGSAFTFETLVRFDDLSEAEIDGIMDLLDDIGIESTLSGGRTVSWAPYMGWIDQRPNQAPGMTPLVNGMNARHHEFFAELGAALSSGLTIRPPVDSVQHTALKKVTAWLRRDQPFTAKVNIDTSRISRIHLPRDEYLRREELLQQGLEMERLARNTTKQEAHG